MNRMLVAGLIPLVLSYGPQSAAERDVSSLPEIRFNDNLTSAGTLHEGVPSVRLSVQRGSWHLLGPDEVGGEALAFAEEGRPPEIPGPMIRVPLGTDVRVAVSNPLDVPLVVHGLAARRVVEMDSLVVPPSMVKERSVAVSASRRRRFFIGSALNWVCAVRQVGLAWALPP